MSCLGDKARDERDPQIQIDQGSVRLSIAQALKRDPRAQRKTNSFFSRHRKRQRM